MATAEAVGVVVEDEVDKEEEEEIVVQEEDKEINRIIGAKGIQVEEEIEVKGIKGEVEVLEPTLAMAPPATLTCPHSRPVNATGPLGRVLFSVWSQERVPGKISTPQDQIIEVLTSSDMNIKNPKYKILYMTRCFKK